MTRRASGISFTPEQKKVVSAPVRSCTEFAKLSASITLNKSLGILFLIGMCQIGFSAVVAPELGIQFIGTERPSSFPKLLLVHVENPGFTPLDLPKMLATSLLIIDGQPSRRSATTYNGPVTGLPPMGE